MDSTPHVPVRAAHLVLLLGLVPFFLWPALPGGAQTLGLDTPTIAATPKGPNQINLKWGGVNNPGYGYAIEIQSDADSRYANWTEIKRVPYWVTEPHYIDPLDGTAAQYPVFGLKNNTAYKFRARSYAGAATYSGYSSPVTAITLNYTVRHVSTAGSDSNTGQTEATAWRHISYAAQRATAGMVVIIHGGSYASDFLRPAKSGSSATNRIVLMADPGETVTITSHGGADWEPNIGLFGKSYVVIDGIKSSVGGPTEPIVHLDSASHHNALVNLEISNRWLWVAYGHHNLFQGNYLHDSGSASGDGGGGAGITLYRAAANRNIVQYNTMRRIAHDCGLILSGGSYNQWMNNVHDCRWGLGWEVVSDNGVAGTYNLFEGNEVMNVATEYTSSVYKPGIEVSGDYTTVRRNVIRDGGQSDSHGIEISSQRGVGGKNNLIYNNTIYRNKGMGVVVFGHAQQTSNVIANNIIYYNNAEGSPGVCNNRTIHMAGKYTGTVVHHNQILFKRDGVEHPSLAIIARDHTPPCLSVSAADTNWSAYFEKNYAVTPGFVDEERLDFHLTPNSSLIDKGVVIPDSTWGALSYKGSAPDIGAYEYSGTPPRSR